MSNFLEELKTTKIISKNDIEKIKKFINIKYKNEDSKRKAYMVSSTIHNIIGSKIDFFPKSIHKDLKNAILKNTFLNNKDSIYLWDIFYSYIDYVDFKKENIKILLNWININIKNETNEESLVNYFYTNNLLKNHEKNGEIKTSSSSSSSSSSNSNSKDSSTKITDEQPYIKIKKADSIYLQNAHTESNNNFINIKQNTANITNNKYNTKSITKKFNIDFLYKNNIFKLYNNSITFALTILFISSISIYLFSMDTSIKTNSKNIIVYENKNVKTKKNNILDKNKHLPQYVKYKTLNNEKLKKYLYTKNSLLADEPYFSSIISSAEEFDINPLILFAITGQEQGFVPKNNKSAKKIGNNPFNVFHSWEEYNSDIKDSSRIAGRTVFNLLKTMPKGQDPFKWVNNTYAEDINWWKGVKSLFNELEKAVK
ncbi:hypothetical protein CF050_14685 [Clostridium botulinum]|uniref:hypothetical protein n=1 Tax=Clostridium botulinum TaxID=1491 RepID=UPI00196A072D|nr:hypothetical protein [Clostridium botulinum]MBN3348091.1 hypothetical protein [Clostridium botulinum]